ncbi:WalW protein [Catenovulum sp. SM1970]|uniref:polysaccharide deacetylase family protein n=1 Tax=Marinifaba aquimaris TaxID=2741323 RepID=UPI0015721C50|nr:polysaccharide deacetylase family protein [Marinifaba aquimaris]NTS78274.1 WalW protein [Marinifaba aquimaris]
MANQQRPTIKFILSVDTEEEWNWSGPFPEERFAVENIKKIPEFQAFCESVGIKPSYFVDYAVANDPSSVDILKSPMQAGQCEIAGHLHPWANPPYFGKTSEFESHVVNLPYEQVEAKLKVLTEKLETVFGVSPQAFRTGRWGINGQILKLLTKYGYCIDSSVYPFYENQYFNCYGAPTDAYWPNYDDVLEVGEQREISQIPVTVGFSNTHFDLSHKIHHLLSRPSLRFFRPIGLAWHLGLLKKLYMSPELSTANEMCLLAKQAIKRGDDYIHMYIHSSSLLSNATGFVVGENPLDDITQAISQVVSFLKQHVNVQFCTISQYNEQWINKSSLSALKTEQAQ